MYEGHSHTEADVTRAYVKGRLAGMVESLAYSDSPAALAAQRSNSSALLQHVLPGDIGA